VKEEYEIQTQTKNILPEF